MDPFAEKDLIELLRSIALSMQEIKDELFDIKIAIRDLSRDDEELEEEILEEDGEDGKLKNEDKENDSGEYVHLGELSSKKEPADRFCVAEEDSYMEIEPNKKFEEDDALDSDDSFKDNSDSSF